MRQNISVLVPNCSMSINKKYPQRARVFVWKGGKVMDYSMLNNGEIIDDGYAFIDNRGIEVCSDSELYDLE